MVLTLLVAAPAAMAGTRADIVDDCFDDGKLDGNYTASQIRDARNNLPADVDQYSDCRDVLARALGGSGTSDIGGGGGARRPAAGRRAAQAERPAEQRALDAAAAEGGDKPVQVGDGHDRARRVRLRRRRRAQRHPGHAARRPDPARPRRARRRRPVHPHDRHPVRPPACPRSPARLTRRRRGSSAPGTRRPRAGRGAAARRSPWRSRSCSRRPRSSPTAACGWSARPTSRSP